MTTLLQAQTQRLTGGSDIVSKATTKAKPRAIKTKAADGTKLFVQTNPARSDVLLTGKGKDGVENAVRFTTRYRAFTNKSLQVSCMAKLERDGKHVGHMISSVTVSSKTLFGLGAAAGGKHVSIVLELAGNGKLVATGVSKGLDLPGTLNETIDVNHPEKSKVAAWLAAASKHLALDYFEPATKTIAKSYRKQFTHMAARAGMDMSSLAKALASLESHGERALSVPISGPGASSSGHELIYGGLACVIGGMGGFMGGGPAGAAWGCIAAFDATMAAQMAKQALETPPPPPPATPPDDDWGGVCEPPIDEPNMSGGPGTDGPNSSEPGSDNPDGDGPMSPGGGGCFVAGTPVATPNGAVAIEQLVAAATVWAGDPGANLTAPRELRRVIPHQSEQILELDFGNEQLRCTPPHPFFTGTWTLAGDLQPGDRVLRRDGGWQTLRAVTIDAVSVPVFDLAVRDLHTFYVGTNELLVHNKDSVEVHEPWDDTGDDDAD